MPLNGSGTYQPPSPQFPAIPNTTILASDFNTILQDVADALCLAVYRDGQAAFEADQSMGNNKLTNLAAGSSGQDATNWTQVFVSPTFTGVNPDPVTLTGDAALIDATILNLNSFFITVGEASTVALPENTSIGQVTKEEIANLHGVLATAAELNILAGATLSTAELNTLSGILATTAELNYSVGVTSDLQEQLDAKAPLDSPALVGTPTTSMPAVEDVSDRIASTKWTIERINSAAFATALPGQAGNAGKYVSTDGVDAFWAELLPPRILKTSVFGDATITHAEQQYLILGAPSLAVDAVLTFESAATLLEGWFCYIKNESEYDLVLTAASGESIDGLASFRMYPGELRMVVSDGGTLSTQVLNPFQKVFTANGTFEPPPGYRLFEGEVIGGGASGTSIYGTGVGGGGGGACVPFKLLASVLSSSVAVTVAATVTGPTSGIGTAGGVSTFGDYVTAYGGAQGNATKGGGGGGTYSAGGGADPLIGGAPSDSFGGGRGEEEGATGAASSVYGGGGGAAAAQAGSSIYGGGGGAGSGSFSLPGTSAFAGSGGASGEDGQAPGGGGGGAYMGSKAGDGARGEVRVRGVC